MAKETKRYQSVPTRKVDFQVDTIQAPDRRIIGGYFSPRKNTLTSNFYKDFRNPWNQSDFVLIHEQKHRDNHQSGVYAYAVSPEQAYKLNMHDEISAKMAELLLARQKYLETGNIAELEDYSYYKDAVAKGEIKPDSPYQEDFDKEMAFIVNKTRDNWLNNFSGDYVDQNFSTALYCSDREGKYTEYHDNNYERGKNICYHIGGVDFTKYIDKEVTISQEGRDKLDNLELSPEKFAQKNNLPEYDGNISLEQYKKLILHKLVADRLESDGIINQAADQALKIPDITGYSQEEKEIFQDQFYKNSRNLRQDFIKTQQQVVEECGANINALVDSAARQGKEKGYSFESNDFLYNQKVDELYTTQEKIYIPAVHLGMYKPDLKFEKINDDLFTFQGKVNVRNVLCPNDNILNSRLSFKTRNIVNQTFPELLQVGQMESMSLHGIVSKSAETAHKTRNKIINPPNTAVPKYRKWEDKDGNRVSEVMYRELPDMTKDIISKPVKSYADEKNKSNDNNQLKQLMKEDRKKALQATAQSGNSNKNLKDTMKKDFLKAKEIEQPADNVINNVATRNPLDMRLILQASQGR